MSDNKYINCLSWIIAALASIMALMSPSEINAADLEELLLEGPAETAPRKVRFIQETDDGKTKTHKETERVVEDVPLDSDKEGVYFLRRKQIEYRNPSIHHKRPDKYLFSVKESEERHGIKENLMFGVYSSFNSKYVSKEQPDSKGPVWQPSATVELYGFGLNVWSNFVLNSEANQGEFNEVDLTTYYTARIGNLTIHPYVMYEFFPNGNPNSLDYSDMTLIEANIYIEYDFGDISTFGRARTRVRGNPGATYAHVGIGYNHKFENGMSLLSSALLNMGDSKYLTAVYGSPTDTNIDALAFMLGCSWEAWKNFTFNPHIDVAVHIIPEIRRKIDQNPNNDNVQVWGGLDLAYNF